MLRIPPLLAQILLVAVISVATAWGWLALIGARVLSPGSVIVCTVIAVALATGVDAGWRHVRRRRQRAARRSHARPRPTTRKPA
ncbi:hypothetical protein ABZX39_33115 [Streptomyces collinus]|uniref:hypothetical protein n=1 Tax=Streptomyces collinus TaxID=42684 RepID=UPI0033A81F34